MGSGISLLQGFSLVFFQYCRETPITRIKFPSFRTACQVDGETFLPAGKVRRVRLALRISDSGAQLRSPYADPDRTHWQHTPSLRVIGGDEGSCRTADIGRAASSGKRSGTARYHQPLRSNWIARHNGW